MKEERKYKEVKTTDLLDFVSRDFPFEDDANQDKQQDYRDELEQRYPYDRFRRKINSLEKDNRELRSAIELLLTHKHGANGEILIPALKTSELWRFK